MLEVVPYLGVVTLGDKINFVQVTVRDVSKGQPYDLTGATAIAFIGRLKASRQTFSIAGALSATPTDGTITLADPTAGVALTGRTRDRLEGQFVFTKGGNPGYTSRTSYDVAVAANA